MFGFSCFVLLNNDFYVRWYVLLQYTVRILTTKNKRNYNLGGYDLKYILILDMFASLFDLSLQTVAYLFVPMVGLLISHMIEQRVFDGTAVYDTIDDFTSHNNGVTINIIVLGFITHGDRTIDGFSWCRYTRCNTTKRL